MTNDYSELGRYILALLDANNFSMRRASLEAGLEASTVHKILDRDRAGTGVPTPETLERLAAALGGDYLQMMRMAGHLPEVSALEMDDAEIYAKMQRLHFLVREIAAKDPAAARRLMGLVITPFEMMLALEEEQAEEEGQSLDGKAVD